MVVGMGGDPVRQARPKHGLVRVVGISVGETGAEK